MSDSITSPRRGAALFVALGISAILAVIITTLFQAAITENMETDGIVLETKAKYLAESGAEYAIKQLKIAKANHWLAGESVNSVVLTGFIPGYEPAGKGEPEKCEIEYRVICQEAPPISRSSTDKDGAVHRYQLFAVSGRGYVPDPVSGRYNEVYVNKMIDLDMVPLFQYLAFYNRYDLEILPGNNASLKGRIHSNRDIYVGAESGKTLTINTESMKMSGALRRHRKEAPTTASNYAMPGTVQIKNKNAPANAPVNPKNYPVMESRGNLLTPDGTPVPTSIAPTGYDSAFNGYDGNNDGQISGPKDLPSFADSVQDRFGGSLATGANSVPVLEAPTEIAPYVPPSNGQPPTHYLNPSTNMWESPGGGGGGGGGKPTSVPSYYLANANLVIASNGSTTIIQDGNGQTLYDSSGKSPNLLVNSSGKPVAPVRDATMFDARETGNGKTGNINLTEIDVSLLNQAIRSDTKQPIFPPASSDPNGSIMYAYRTDTSTEQPNGIRLVNGSQLNNKLTFVTEDPLYVKGDFNTAAKGDKGTILIADSINLLSNEWNDSKSAKGSLSVPKSNLEVNAAMMSGGYETVSPTGNSGGKYNGGFENMPRFHEDWAGSGKSVNILGSFISLFTSKYGTGTWVYGGNRYTAPVRNWFFNSKFLDPSYQPPGFPFSVGETRVVWWTGRRLDWWPTK